MVRRMARSFEDFERQLQRAEFFGIRGDESRQIFGLDGGELVFAFAAERENFAEQVCESARTSALKRILPDFETFDGFRVQDDFRICGGENFVQESGVVIVCMREENVADVFR